MAQFQAGYAAYMAFVDSMTHKITPILPSQFAKSPEIEHERVKMVLAFSMMHTAVFYISSLFFALLDHFELLQRWRIQPKAYAPRSLILKAIGHTLFNHFVVNPLIFYFAWPWLSANGIFATSVKSLPSTTTMLKHILACVAFEDTTFYWLHRLLHTKYFYAAVHKQHHGFKQNVGVAAEYASPIEEIVGTSLPFLGASILLKVHLSTFLVWTFLRITETVNSHSGYYMPWVPYNWFPSVLGGADRHDYHHSKNVGSYGSWTRFWDWACGTDVSYWRASQNKRS